MKSNQVRFKKKRFFYFALKIYFWIENFWFDGDVTWKTCSCSSSFTFLATANTRKMIFLISNFKFQANISSTSSLLK
jgi:hypothetical protein